MGSESCGWFTDPARDLLGSDPGYALHVLTEVPERSCYRYVSETDPRPPTGWIIRQLLRSEQGRQWLNALMDGSKASWWREHQQLQANADRFKEIARLVSG